MERAEIYRKKRKESTNMFLTAVVLIGAGAAALGVYIQKDQAEVERIDQETTEISRQISLTEEEKTQLISQIPPKDTNSNLGRIGAFSAGMGLIFAAAAAAQATQER